MGAGCVAVIHPVVPLSVHLHLRLVPQKHLAVLRPPTQSQMHQSRLIIKLLKHAALRLQKVKLAVRVS